MVSIQAQWSPKKQEEATKAASAHQQHHYLNPSPAVVDAESERATGNCLEASCLLVKEAAALVQQLQQAPTSSNKLIPPIAQANPVPLIKWMKRK
jgi:hypothetical protein